MDLLTKLFAIGGTLAVVWAYLVWGLEVLFVRHRVYRTSEETSNVKKVMQAAYALRWKHVDGVQRVRNLTLPSYIVTPSTLMWITAERIGIDGELHARIDVLRWRWLAPLIPDPPYCAPPRPDTITVLEKYDNHVTSGVTSTKEVVLPHGVGTAMREYLQSIAQEIIALYRERQYQGIVVVLHGLQGCGKSSVARLLTKLLQQELGMDACLYPLYNPTRPGECFTEVVRPYVDDHHVVVVCDEFDECLKSIKAKTVETNDDVRVDAKDKASWNGLMDTVHRKLNTILVLTTNATPTEVREQCVIDGSMVRNFRIDMWREVTAVVEAPLVPVPDDQTPWSWFEQEAHAPATPSETSETTPLLDVVVE